MRGRGRGREREWEGGRTGEREKRKEVARPHTAGKVATWMTRRRVGRGNERARWNSTGAEGQMGGGEVQWNRVYSLCRAYGYALFFYRSLTPLRSAVAFTTSLATIRLRSQGRSCAIFARSERSARFSSRGFSFPARSRSQIPSLSGSVSRAVRTCCKLSVSR